MIVTRFAPSPTGYLHIGGLRTALFNWLWARKNGGKFILRIEDTDLARNSEEATKAILEAFDWVGLDYDGDVAYQSKRFDIYKRYIQKLLDEGKAYYCYMSKEELDRLREEQMKRGERPRYDRRYRDFTGTPPQGVQPVVRIKAPLEGDIVFEDGIKGIVTIKAEELDDFIIARSDGTPTYNFVVAIDDALMGVTDVIRGDDHLYNTPKQIIVYEALGLPIPRFYHVPMILNEQGKKLSKRDGAMDVMEYKKMGYLPEALLNFLVRLGWSHGDQEIFSLQEMKELFDPKDINKSASAYNLSKLQWLNAHYIKNTPNEKLVKLLEEFGLFLSDHDKKEILLDALKERAKTLQELADMAKEILEAPKNYDEKGVKKALKGEWKAILELFLQKLKASDAHLPSDFHAIIEAVVEEKEIGFGKIGQPLRLALLGKMAGPDLSDVMAIIGKEETIARVEKLIKEKGNS
ncbi:glutamate--tRNA ligase [Nitratiruptor sp. SB155-2]|uniref:Glutamate--tRNA ligase 2 n=1 Tax=Nitratiruptor sp. (strain SB155-2) TaxID=387092 RepID=SYE2_NITSB|nr:glutamate--tRNA ligase [Nitratiruptor sp. SB155-2]A6Q5I8.1 RecName: Full=Glutamate--tRNA ligase 2; AltName: Full=Glutamyl-tRNA synthetase 2; Short=GluRS 2 [Nitratiruptor sp. SB155-2]BAF70747.1 glutamyl-tRNA synthetase [Nitratiruptor sp. SB155-2]